MYFEKRCNRHSILSRLHSPPSHTLTGWKLLISHLQSSPTWNPFSILPTFVSQPIFAMQVRFLSIPAMFESIHLCFSILTTPPQGLGAPPTEPLLPSLLAPHWVGWQERRHRQQGVGWACQRVLPPCWVTGIRALLWGASIPFREDIEEEGQRQLTGVAWHSPYGRIELVPLVITGKTNRWHQCWFYLCDPLPVCVCSTCTCADEELGLSNTQLHFVQGYGNLQGACNGETKKDRKMICIITASIGNTNYFQQWRNRWLKKIAFKMPLLLVL